jgi:threonine dehydratase
MTRLRRRPVARGRRATNVKQNPGIDGNELQDFRKRILRAERRIRPYVRETPVDFSVLLSHPGGARVYFKLEHLQHTGSFKLRGAVNKMLSLPVRERSRGVVAASSGNHGIAVCHASRQLGLRATICMPRGAAGVKLRLIRALGGRVVFHGQNTLDAERKAREIAAGEGLAIVPPYNDPEVIAGQGTIGLELERQVGRVDAVFVAVGGGGLVSGIAAALKSKNPRAEIVGCWPANSRVLYESLRAGRIIEFPEQPTISDGTAGGVEPGSITFPLCRTLVGTRVLVSEREIWRAMRLLLADERWLVEGAAGVALAGFLKRRRACAGKNVVVILCGRNISPEKAAKLWKSS